MLKIKAYHWINDVAREMMLNASGSTDMIKIGVTHKCLPVEMDYNNTSLVTDAEDVLGRAFDFFNWMADGREGQAPKEVNLFCIAHEVHSSQSVGDIVEIVGEGFWLVDSVGWIKLDKVA